MALCNVQLARLNLRLQQQGMSLAERQRQMEKRPAAPVADARGSQALASSAAQRAAPLQSLPHIPLRCLPLLTWNAARLLCLTLFLHSIRVPSKCVKRHYCMTAEMCGTSWLLPYQPSCLQGLSHFFDMI